MDDQKEQEARWRETLALLGLPADTAQDPVAVPAPAVTAPALTVAIEEAPEPIAPPPSPEPMAVCEDVALEMPDVVDEVMSDTEVEMIDAPELVEPDASLDEPSDATEEGAPHEGIAASPGGEDEKPRKGRRRRRRGRRRGGDKAEGDAVAPQAEKGNARAPTEGSEKKTPRQDRPSRDRNGPESRNRGRDDRGAPKAIDEDRWEEETPIEEVEDVDVAQPLPTDDNEELDTLADWDVPSWQDLISSLYRPER